MGHREWPAKFREETVAKMFSNSMHWAWKVTFAAALAHFIHWLLNALHDLGSERYAGLNADVIEMGLIPLGLWFLVRWVALAYLPREQDSQ
jgi:hypothetical protein